MKIFNGRLRTSPQPQYEQMKKPNLSSTLQKRQSTADPRIKEQQITEFAPKSASFCPHQIIILSNGFNKRIDE